MSASYDDYLVKHVAAVNNGIRWMMDNIPLMDLGFTQHDISCALDSTMVHDYSKRDASEYGPYDLYFYGGNRSHEVVKEFAYAWLYHANRNPHHWQYWVMINDDPDEKWDGMKFEEKYGNVVAFEIPKHYILEMIADWWSFSWREEKFGEIFNWYHKHQDHIIMHSKSRKLVEDVLDAIREKLVTDKAIDDNLIVEHSGIEGQKWGVRNGPPYPLGSKEKLNSIKKLNDLMNNGWDYGVLDNGKHLLDTEDYDWDKNYRTIPVDTLEKEKIGTCWDFVNYQHDKLKNMGIKDDSYLITIQKSEKPNDIVTHTFTTFELGDKKYWLESAAWPKRGVHEINDIEDVAKELNEMYHSPGFGLSVFKYNPEGMDRGLTSNEFFDKASQDLVYDVPSLKHDGLEEKPPHSGRYPYNSDNPHQYGVPEQKKFPLPDKDHVLSAIRFFNYVDPKYEKELAEAILNKIKEYDMDFDEIGVGEENRFKNYIPEKKRPVIHYGTKGMRWGVRRWQNEDGTFNAAGKRRYFSLGSGENYRKLANNKVFDYLHKTGNDATYFSRINDQQFKGLLSANGFDASRMTPQQLATMKAAMAKEYATYVKNNPIQTAKTAGSGSGANAAAASTSSKKGSGSGSSSGKSAEEKAQEAEEKQRLKEEKEKEKEAARIAKEKEKEEKEKEKAKKEYEESAEGIEEKVFSELDKLSSLNSKSFDVADILSDNNAEFKHNLSLLTGVSTNKLTLYDLESLREKIRKKYDIVYGDEIEKATLDAITNKYTIIPAKEEPKKESKYSEYKDGDSDFDDSNYDDKNRLGDTDFFGFKTKDGRSVIVEEDMKWTLPEGVDTNSPKIKKALEEFSKNKYKGDEWKKKATEAINNAIQSDTPKQGATKKRSQRY